MAKFKSYEEGQEALTAAREERDVAANEFKAFCKENKCSKDEPPTDPKLLKKFTTLKELRTKKRAAVEEVDNWLKENKPKKPKKERVTKYDYPADCTTTSDKKKFRAAQRAAAKKAEKEAAGGKKDKKEKSEKKESKGDKQAKKDGKKADKKDKKEKKEEKVED